MREEHEELHRELKRATMIPGKVGEAAKRVAEVLHPHFEKENAIALPELGVARELAEGKTSTDFPKALKLCDKFKLEYPEMLKEHVAIVKALNELEKNADIAKKRSVVEFSKRLKLHAQTEEALTYPAALMIGKQLKQR